MAPTGQTTTPEEPQETAEQPTARAPRRRRKATAAATAPEPAPQAPDQDLTQGPAGPAQDPDAAQDADPAPDPEQTASPAWGRRRGGRA